jgi:lysophospholipase
LAHSASSYTFSSENDLVHLMAHDIKQFWQTGHFSDFDGQNKVRINYVAFTKKKHAKSLIILPGRTEGYLKYKELAFDLDNQGFNVYIIDHRGQGLSGRMLSNPHKGYVESFDLYHEDLHTFIKNIVRPQCDNKPYLLAHSMGGAIAIRYMQEHPGAIRSAVLSSPMISISTGSLPNSLVMGLVTGLAFINRLLSKTPWYFIGQGNYRETSYQKNELTQSIERHGIFNNIYKENRDLQLGGVTTYWLEGAVESTKQIFDKIKQLEIPILVLQSGADTIVDNKAQNEFCRMLHQVNKNSCPNGLPILIKDARHELLLEKDNLRHKALVNTLEWYKNNANS